MNSQQLRWEILRGIRKGMLSWTSRCLQKQHPLSETDVDKDKLGQWSRRKQTLHNIIGDVSEKESEKEIQHKEKDQEEVHVGRIFRKPSLPLPILAQKRKEPFVSSSGVPARPKFCIPSSVFSTSATQTERKCIELSGKKDTKTLNILLWSRKSEDKAILSKMILKLLWHCCTESKELSWIKS